TADAEAAAADLRAAALSLAAQTAKSWFAAAEAVAQLELALGTEAIWQRSLDLAQSRFERGLRPALDVRLVRTDIEDARALVEARRRQADALRRQLEVLVGRYPGGEIEALGGLPDPGGPPPAGLPSELLQRRHDVVAAEHRLAAADARVASARASLYPRLSLTGSGGTASEDLADLVDADFRVWSIAGNLAAPLFEGGRLRANVARHEAERRAALAAFQETLLDAFREVETALAAEERLSREAEHRAAEVEEAEAARALAEDRYARGLTDVTTLLAAQRRELMARSALLDVRRRRLDNRIDLHLALGGGFDRGEARSEREAP